jgi:hypothetical protein
MKSKKIFFSIIFIIMIALGIMVYFGIGIFAPEEETKFTSEEAGRLEDLARRLFTPNPVIRNPDIPNTGSSTEYEVPQSSLLLPIIEYQAAEENLNYLQCLDCEFKEEHPDICVDHQCTFIGTPTNHLNFFFCDNPYIDGWDSGSFTINDLDNSYPSNLGTGNNDFYTIFRCLDTYKKDLVRNSGTCEELLDKTRSENQNIITHFLDELPANIKTELEEAIGDQVNGIPETGNTIDDYVLHNLYIQYINPAFSGFTNDYKDQLDELEESKFSEEVDSIFATCFGIHTAPSPEDVSCPLDGLPTARPLPPIQTPSIQYAELNSECPGGKRLQSADDCSTAFMELSNQFTPITPISMNNSNFPYGCGLVLGSDLIFNNNSSGSPNPSVAPLCNR